MIATDLVLLTPVDTSASRRRLGEALLVFPRPRIRVFRYISLRREQQYCKAGVSHFLETHNGKARAYNEFLDPIQLYSKGTRHCNEVASLLNVLQTQIRKKKERNNWKKEKEDEEEKVRPVDVNYRRITIISQTRSQHDVDHGWIVNHSWMTFTHARYAFTLKIPARVHSAGNDVAHFVTSVYANIAAAKPRAILISGLREIEKHATFARGNGPVLVRANFPQTLFCR